MLPGTFERLVQHKYDDTSKLRIERMRSAGVDTPYTE